MTDRSKQVVSANDLFDGDVVYLTAHGTWTRVLDDAAIADNETAASALLAIAGRQPERVVGPYLVGVEQGATALAPAHIRERLRESGPSIPQAGARRYR